MTTYLGPGDLKNRVLPDGWDADELEKRRTEANITIEEIATEVSGAISALNRELMSDPLYSLMWSLTRDPTVEYPVGSTNDWVRMPEYAKADAKRGKTQGHMLPLLDWVHPLAWTWKYLRRCRRISIEADVQGLITGGRNRVHKSLLTRFTQSADDSGVSELLGSAGYSPGFAHAAASTSVDFTPPEYDGKSFDSDHEHYDATNSTAAADWQAAIEAMALDLAEHGHESPFILLVSYLDRATIAGLSTFVERALPNIVYGSAVDLVQAEDIFFGALTTDDGTVLVASSNRLPQYSMMMWKSYGVLSPRNPLALYMVEGQDLLIDLLPDRSYQQFPLEGLVGYSEFGVGVKDRTAGVCHQMNTASYSDPSIS